LINSQTFFNGILAFKALDRPSFGIHQAAIFPVYFSLQSFLPLFVALTGIQKINSTHPADLGLGRCMTMVSIAGLINLIIFRPLTRDVVKARKHQGMPCM
jgi:hypothetical protein